MLITDRTESDVLLAETLIAQGRTTGDYLKGSYTAVYDMNRVEREIERLNSMLAQYGYQTSNIDTKVWTDEDIVNEAEVERYLGNITSLLIPIQEYGVLPPVPGKASWLGYSEANDIEQILVNIGMLINRIFKSFRRSNSFMFYSGHHPLPSAENDPGRTIDDIEALNLTVDNLDAHGTDFYILMYGVIK